MATPRRLSTECPAETSRKRRSAQRVRMASHSNRIINACKYNLSTGPPAHFDTFNKDSAHVRPGHVCHAQNIGIKKRFCREKKREVSLQKIRPVNLNKLKQGKTRQNLATLSALPGLTYLGHVCLFISRIFTRGKTRFCNGCWHSALAQYFHGLHGHGKL
jgi:hypothetical protein